MHSQLDLYREMLRIRLFEEKVLELQQQQKLFGPVHVYIGEEAVAVGVCSALKTRDYITSTHRGHGHCLAKGANMDRMFAELLGKATGYCCGKGGSMHIADPDTGNLGANGIVGGSAGIATGAALSSKIRGSNQVAVCFFGDGALGQGIIYESMNMASLWKLPVIYVCENNLYSEFGHYREITAGGLLERAQAFGIQAEEVDGQDVELVAHTAQRLVERARQGEGPAFLMCHTYRFFGHYTGDLNRAYRTKEEENFWKENRDPIKLLESQLRDFEKIREAVQKEVGDAIKFAFDAPYPEASEVTNHVYHL